MTDRELLEAAAKAAGYDFYWSGLQQCVFVKDGKGSATQWNPLTSDADAFRLMVDCGIRVWAQANYVDASSLDLKSSACVYYDDHNNDIYATARRAIVRAAAGE